MDCTLRIIAGPEAGQEIICTGAETYLGRSQRCALRLTSPAISFEHALITRVADDFFVENLSANGTLLNNERLPAKTRLRIRDRIHLCADTIVRVEKLPAAAAAGSMRRWLLMGFVAMLVIALIVVIIDPFSTTSIKNSQGLYRYFQQYAQEQVETNGMPREIPKLLADAWRMESAGDRANAAKKWMLLHLALDDWDHQRGRIETSVSESSLKQLENGQDIPDEEKPTVFKQFAIRMGRLK